MPVVREGFGVGVTGAGYLGPVTGAARLAHIGRRAARSDKAKRPIAGPFPTSTPSMVTRGRELPSRKGSIG